MIFFTKELFLKLNSGNVESTSKANKEWVSRRKTYFEDHLPGIKGLMPVKLYQFASKVDLQDGVLLNFTYGDHFQCNGKWQKKRRHGVELKVLHPKGKFIYTLVFGEIRRCLYDYPTEYNFIDNYNIWQSDDWAFEEITLTDDNWLRFELWFYTGTTVLIEFKRFTYLREKANSSTLPI